MTKENADCWQFNLPCMWLQYGCNGDPTNPKECRVLREHHENLAKIGFKTNNPRGVDDQRDNIDTEFRSTR